MDLQYAQQKTLARLAAYAGLSADQDTRVSAAQAMRQEVIQLFAQFAAAWSFVEPELLTMDPAALTKAIAAPGLKPYAFNLQDVVRRKAHTLDAEQ